MDVLPKHIDGIPPVFDTTYSDISASKNKLTSKSNPAKNLPHAYLNAEVNSSWTLGLFMFLVRNTGTPTRTLIALCGHMTDIVCIC